MENEYFRIPVKAKECYLGPFDQHYSRNNYHIAQRKEYEQYKNKSKSYSKLAVSDVFSREEKANNALCYPESEHILSLVEQKKKYQRELIEQEKEWDCMLIKLHNDEKNIEKLKAQLKQEKECFEERQALKNKIEKNMEITRRYIHILEQNISSEAKQYRELQNKHGAKTLPEMQMKDNLNSELFKTQSHDTSRQSEKQKPIHKEYAPGNNVLEYLSTFHGIPTFFIEDELIKFKIYYTETQTKRSSWDNTFYTWVSKNWKRQKNQVTITENFKPELATLQALKKEGISHEFCIHELQGFIVYWQQNNGQFTPQIWQERFLNWIRRANQRQKQHETYKRTSYPTTEEVTNAELSEKYQFNFDYDEDE